MIKAGFARVDVTPPLGTPIAGYFKVRASEGVLDPIELNAIALGNENDAILLITCDFTGMTMARITPVRERISALTGVPVDHILITSLHTPRSNAVCTREKQEQKERKSDNETLYHRTHRKRILPLSGLADRLH